MNDSRPRKVLFSGYAPVHFLCFLPVYEELRDDGDLDVWLSGGFRRKDEAGERIYDLAGFYDPFPVNPERVIPFDQAREQEFDVAICAHTSGDLLPNRVGKTVQIFHGVSFKNFAVREKVLQYDLLCLPGRYHGERFRDQGLIREGSAKCLITGFPKADRLVRGGFDRDGFLRSAGLDVGRPTVLYAPTGGKNNSLETVGEDVISAIVADGRWNLLVKPHDHPKRKIDWFSRLASLECDRMRMARGLDVVEYLLAADLLLTDASSVAVEYTLVDRPMVFIDVPKLLKNVLTRGAPLDLATYGRRIGALAHNAEEVVAEIDRGLAAPAARSELRRAMAGDVFHEPGGAAERVAEVVRWAAGLRPDLPSGVEVLEP
jgi:CDP-glycerol glycerophosphotransferase (TagB/SpsB family)